MPSVDEIQSPEPLGVSYTLGELERMIGRAVNRYGGDTKIFGSNGLGGITLAVLFPKGERPRISFAEIEVAYSDSPPENLV
jgi:hypothetical protein